MDAKRYTKEQIEDYNRLKVPVDKVFKWLLDKNIIISDDAIDLFISDSINLADKGLRSIPNEFRVLNCKILDLSGNNFGDGKGLIPLCYLRNLHSLNLYGCRLTGFPDEFIKHREFNQLILSNNNLTDIPEGVYGLNYIDYLNISNNPIKQFSIEALTNIKSEWVKIDNKKRQIPKSLNLKDIKIYFIEDDNVPSISLD